MGKLVKTHTLLSTTAKDLAAPGGDGGHIKKSHSHSRRWESKMDAIL